MYKNARPFLGTMRLTSQTFFGVDLLRESGEIRTCRYRTSVGLTRGPRTVVRARPVVGWSSVSEVA